MTAYVHSKCHISQVMYVCVACVQLRPQNLSIQSSRCLSIEVNQTRLSELSVIS